MTKRGTSFKIHIHKITIVVMSTKTNHHKLENLKDIYELHIKYTLNIFNVLNRGKIYFCNKKILRITYSNCLFSVDTIPTSISLGLKSTAKTCDKHDMAS